MKKLLAVLLIIWLIFSNWYAITVDVPPADFQDIVWWTSQKIQSSDATLLNTIQAINYYLRFSIWVAAFAAVTYWGYGLITWEWDAWKLKKANNIILWWGIWLFIAVFAYTLVRLVVNLL